MDEVQRGMIALLPRLRRFAFALTRDMDRADDLVQETCARALARRDQWQTGTRLDSWMYKIAQNIWLDQRRSPRGRSEVPMTPETADVPGVDGRRITEDRARLAAVGRGLEELSPEQQALVLMVCVEGVSYKEAADIQGVPIGTIMSRLSAARKALHRYLETGAARNEKVR